MLSAYVDVDMLSRTRAVVFQIDQTPSLALSQKELPVLAASKGAS